MFVWLRSINLVCESIDFNISIRQNHPYQYCVRKALEDQNNVYFSLQFTIYEKLVLIILWLFLFQSLTGLRSFYCGKRPVSMSISCRTFRNRTKNQRWDSACIKKQKWDSQ